MRRLASLLVGTLAALTAVAPPALGAIVEGTVTPLAWAQEVEVCVANVEVTVPCAVPRADGTYATANLGGNLKFEFIPSFRSRLLPQYFDHQSTLAGATVVNVPGDSGIVVQGIDADLSEGSAISGTVTSADTGGELTEVRVCATSIVSGAVTVCDETDADGKYELHSLVAGPFAVGFWGHGTSAEYQPSFYQGQTSLAQATPVVVRAGESRPEIDASLAKGGRIEGMVSAAADGAPLGAITVCLFSTGGATALRCTESAPNGSYSFHGLPSAAYQVGFGPGNSEISAGGSETGVQGFVPQYYDRVADRARASAILLIAPEVVSNVDAALSIRAPQIPAVTLPPAAAPLVAAPPIATPPALHRTPCAKPKRRKRINGKTRCVKPTKHKKRRHARGKPRHRRKSPE